MKSLKNFTITWLCLVFCFAFAYDISAQENVGEEVMIHTKDRSIYRGIITEDADSYVRVKIQTGDILNISRDEIRKIKYEKKYHFYNNGKSHKTTGYFCSINFGLGIELGGPVYGIVEAELLAGKRLSPRISAGILLSLNGQSFDIGNSSTNQEYVTFGGHGRYYLTDHRVKTFLYSQISYGIAISNLYFAEENGKQVKIQNGLGLHFASYKKYRITLSIAHNLQHMKGTSLVWSDFNFFDPTDFRSFDFWANNAFVKVGLEF